MIGKKTAALFDVSCAMGAICATNKKKDIKNLSSFGKNLGIAFQITDDLIGVMGDPKITKKPVGNDLREGKKSLPILMAIKLAKGKNKKTILKAFGNHNISKSELKKAMIIDPASKEIASELRTLYKQEAADYEKQSEYIKAAEIYEKMLTIDPYNPANIGIYMQLGYIYKSYELYDKAIAAYESVSRFDPLNFDAFSELREIEILRGMER